MKDIEEQYFIVRVDDQINWYSKKIKYFKKLSVIFKLLQIIFALSIPGFIFFMKAEQIDLTSLISVVGFFIFLAVIIPSLLKFEENAVQYKVVLDSLLFEKFLFLSKASHYQYLSDPFPLFVERFETVLHGGWERASHKWNSYAGKKEEETDISKKEEGTDDTGPMRK